MKNFNLKPKSLFLNLSLLAFCFLFLNLTTAFAQTVSLGIYPPVIQISATPPTSIKSPMTIQNQSDKTVELSIELKPFTAADSADGKLRYLNPGERFGEDKDIFQKIQITDGSHTLTTITLAPQEKKNLEMHIGIPANEPASDYYFSILFVSKPQLSDQSNGSAVSAAIGTNVLLSIGPQDKTSGTVQFDSPLFVTGGPVPFLVNVNDTSNHFIAPIGTILIKNFFGQIIGKVDLLPVNVLNHTNRFIPDNKSNNFTNAIWPEKFLLGPYTATLTIALSGEGPLYRQTTYFFAMPIQVLVGLLLGICIVIFIVYRVRLQLKHPSD